MRVSQSVNLPANPSQSVRCVSCRARNVAGRKTCDLCGVPLPKQSLCPNCGQSRDDETTACPGCGRLPSKPAEPVLRDASPMVAEPPTPPESLIESVTCAALSTPPSGWHITPQANGMVQMERTWWNRLTSNDSTWTVAILLPIVFYQFFAIFSRVAIGNRDYSHSLFFALAVSGGILFLALLWVFCGRDTLIVGPQRLTRHRSFLGWDDIKTMEGVASLHVREERHARDYRRHAQTIKRLLVENGGQSLQLESTTRTHGGLLDLTGSPVGDDRVETMALYVSALTGWHVVGLRTLPRL